MSFANQQTLGTHKGATWANSSSNSYLLTLYTHPLFVRSPGSSKPWHQRKTEIKNKRIATSEKEQKWLWRPTDGWSWAWLWLRCTKRWLAMICLVADPNRQEYYYALCGSPKQAKCPAGSAICQLDNNGNPHNCGNLDRVTVTQRGSKGPGQGYITWATLEVKTIESHRLSLSVTETPLKWELFPSCMRSKANSSISFHGTGIIKCCF